MHVEANFILFMIAKLKLMTSFNYPILWLKDLMSSNKLTFRWSRAIISGCRLLMQFDVAIFINNSLNNKMNKMMQAAHLERVSR